MKPHEVFRILVEWYALRILGKEGKQKVRTRDRDTRRACTITLVARSTIGCDALAQPGLCRSDQKSPAYT